MQLVGTQWVSVDRCPWWAHDGYLWIDVYGGAESLLGGVGLSCMQAEEVLEMVLTLGEVHTNR